MDNIKIFFSLFLLSISWGDSEGTDCPSNTVEIVFTKKGVICATTSSVPELNHLSVHPKQLPSLLGEPPIGQKVSSPFLTHPFISGPPPPQHMILQQLPVQHIGQDLRILAQPIPAEQLMIQPLVYDQTEYMTRRLPLYHENTINQNLDYIDRRPDLMEDKRLYYQKMLWEKLRRDAFLKKLVRNNQLFGVQYIDDINNNNNNLQIQDNQQKTNEELSQNTQQMSQNTENIEENPEPEQRPPEQTQPQSQPQQEQVSEEQPNNSENNNNNDYNDNQSQEPNGFGERTNEKEQILKDYLKYLNKKEDSSPVEQNNESQRDSRQYDMGSASTNSRVPDVITGYMPAESISTNGHTFGMKILKTKKTENEYIAEEPVVSQSQVSFKFLTPDGRPFIQNLRFPQKEDNDQSLRLVGTGMTFGHRVSSQDNDNNPSKFGYGYKSYPEYNEEKAKKFRAKSKYLGQPFIKNKETIEEDVVLVTADPNQREIIETIEAQNSRRNYRKFNSDWTGSRGLVDNNNAIDYQMNKDFRIDESRIEYNGWRPLRLQSRQSEEPIDESPKEEEEILKSSSSAKVISILPITGRVNNNWRAI